MAPHDNAPQPHSGPSPLQQVTTATPDSQLPATGPVNHPTAATEPPSASSTPPVAALDQTLSQLAQAVTTTLQPDPSTSMAAQQSEPVASQPKHLPIIGPRFESSPTESTDQEPSIAGTDTHCTPPPPAVPAQEPNSPLPDGAMLSLPETALNDAADATMQPRSQQNIMTAAAAPEATAAALQATAAAADTTGAEMEQKAAAERAHSDAAPATLPHDANAAKAAPPSAENEAQPRQQPQRAQGRASPQAGSTQQPPRSAPKHTEPNPRRFKPDAKPQDLYEAERTFVANTGGLRACAQSYLAMTCTHDSETFLASASLALQYGEDIMLMTPQQLEYHGVNTRKRMLPCHYCRVQQTLWAFRLHVHNPVRPFAPPFIRCFVFHACILDLVVIWLVVTCSTQWCL